ncbi:hypothetical protein ABPG75_001930 [Micractinium tetrahymenae]
MERQPAIPTSDHPIWCGFRSRIRASGHRLPASVSRRASELPLLTLASPPRRSLGRSSLLKMAAARCQLSAASAQRAAPAATSPTYGRAPWPIGVLRAPVSVSWKQHQRHSLRQQQEQRRRQRQRPAAASGGGWSSDESVDIFARALEEYDRFIEQSKQNLEEGKTSLEELDAELTKMRAEGVMPGWIVSVAVWTRRVSNDTLAVNQRRYDALTSRRGEFAAALRALQEELRASPPLLKPDPTCADWLALTGYTWAQQLAEGEDVPADQLQQQLREAVDQTAGPSTVLWVCITSCLLSGWLAGTAGSWAGYDAYRLLHEAPSPGAAASWLAWTAPFVLGTVVTQNLAPTVFQKSMLRPLANDQSTFFRKMSLPPILGSCAVVAFCQCLVYQGLWQDVFTSWLGGVRDPLLIADPDALLRPDQPMLGTLAGGLLPAFIVAPSAAVLTGALEGYWQFFSLSLRDASSRFTLAGETIEAKDWMEGPGGSLEPTSVTADERLLICARTALGSAWLALETTLTGSLWLAAATSTVGLVTAVLLSQRSSRT